MRRSLIAGNWKMFTSLTEGRELAAAVAAVAAKCSDRDVMLAPPFTHLTTICEATGNTANLFVAGQNVAWEKEGAFTGEISPLMLREAGCSMAIIGHSERRHIFGENDDMVNKRVRGAAHFGLTPILCIGETLAQREAGQTMAVLEQQTRKGLAGVSPTNGTNLIMAYEPVWAIGTGKTASNDQAQEAHSFVRSLLADIFEKNIASQIRILYGGSVKPDNVDGLMAKPDIDGALVGGASLKIETFSRIIRFQ
ncbi:MAG: triose-phosphate isomerase [Deltaproteobacteria bacterium]